MIVLGFSLLFTAIAAAVSFFAFRHAFVENALENLSLKAGERAGTQATILDIVRVQNQSATLLLERKLRQISDASVEADFAAIFPTDPDGVARSTPEIFSGRDLPNGER